MIKKTLNYIDANGNNATDQIYYISEDSTFDQILEDIAITNCPNCWAPVDIRAEKCPYCDTPYKLKRGKRAELLIYEDSCLETKLSVQHYEDIIGAGYYNDDFGERLSRYLKGEGYSFGE